MVCLDTSVLIPIIRKEKRAIEKLRAEAQNDTSVSTTTISLCELYAGAFASRDPKKELEKVNEVVSTLRILDLNHGASRRFGEQSENLKKYPIGDFDLLIACVAMEFGEALATRNSEHFKRVPGLQVDSW